MLFNLEYPIARPVTLHRLIIILYVANATMSLSINGNGLPATFGTTSSSAIIRPNKNPPIPKEPTYLVDSIEIKNKSKINRIGEIKMDKGINIISIHSV